VSRSFSSGLACERSAPPEHLDEGTDGVPIRRVAEQVKFNALGTLNQIIQD
jgi:hypothetical protein